MIEKIKAILADLHPEIDFNNVTDNLVGDGVIDSFDIVQIISDLESTFNISISALDLLPENFESFNAIIALVNKYQS